MSPGYFVGLDLSLAGTGGVVLDALGEPVAVLAFSTSEREVKSFSGHPTIRVYLSPEVELGDARASWARTVAVSHAVRAWLAPYGPLGALAAIEDHAYGVQTNATYRLGHLHGIVRRDVQELFIRFLLVEPTTVKLAATGSGRAEKPQMIAATQAAGFDLARFGATTRHNVADAYWLARCAWTWARLREGRGREAVHITESMRAIMLPSKRKPGLLAREPMP